MVTDCSHIVVTGQPGCGKTTVARMLSQRGHLSHVALDDFIGREDAHEAAAAAISGTVGGWVVDGCVWQVPPGVWESADLVIHLDYAKRVHYARILRRALRRLHAGGGWAVVRDEWDNARVVRRWADENRAAWAAAGGITTADVEIVRCRNPREAQLLIARITG